MDSTPLFELSYDPAACDWNQTIDNFYAENPGLLGRVMLLLKPTKTMPKCKENSKQLSLFTDSYDLTPGGAYGKAQR